MANPPAPLTRFRAALARPRGHKRVDALLAADDAASQVQALGVPDLYFLIKDVGIADCYELLALASTEQIQGCIDLDIWERDRPQLEGLKPWLAAIADGGYEQLGQVWRALDPELCALALARWTRIWDHSLGEAPPEDEDGSLYATPDSFFTLGLPDDSDDAGFVARLLDDLYRFDGDVARHTIMAARSEPTAALEEYAYRWQSGRLADLGYVDFYEALEVFRPLDPSSVAIDEGTQDVMPTADDDSPASLPARLVESVIGRAFLARALDQIHDPKESERIEAGLLLLVNRVLAAARVSPADSEAIDIGAEHAMSTLALGLEKVSGGDLELATKALRSVALMRLHRVGYTVTLSLGRLSRALIERSRAADETAQAVLLASLRARPFFPRVLETPPADGVRPFESLADVKTVASYLSRLTFQLAFADVLGIDTVALAEAPQPRPEIADFLRTAIARVVAGGELRASPIDATELEALLAAFDRGVLGDDKRTTVAAAVTAHLDDAGLSAGREHLAELLSLWLDEIQDELGGATNAADVDQRFVGRLVFSQSRS